MKKRKRTDLQKEKIIMMTASVFVLTALTMTGIYVKDKNSDNKDGYVVDFSKIEEQAKEDTPAKVTEQIRTNEIASNDLDVDPQFQEANSGKVEIPGVTISDSPKKPTVDAKEEIAQAEEKKPKIQETTMKPADKTYSFDKEDYLQWPIVGNILLNYSMDKTIYFSTLEQYKYNPALVISAVKGEPIVAAAEGKIESVFMNEEIGNGLTISLGNGYELTYGQLEKIAVSEGESVSKGQIVAYVADPTKYYSVEGTNVYFKLTKDAQPVDPMAKLQ